MAKSRCYDAKTNNKKLFESINNNSDKFFDDFINNIKALPKNQSLRHNACCDVPISELTIVNLLRACTNK